MKILFVNHSIRRCGVYQYGLAAFDAIQKIDSLEMKMVEVNNKESLSKEIFLFNPDTVVYNYHPVTLPFITSSLLAPFRSCLHVGLVHRLNQDQADSLGENSLFDFYIMGDPTLVERNPRVFKIGRIIPFYENNYPIPQIPTIGSFGFAGSSKGFERLVDLVKRDFDQAIIKINIPPNSFIDPNNKWLNYFVTSQSQKLKGSNIELQVSTEFFSENELLNFLAKNSINVFPYPTWKRKVDFGGISSAVDQAIAARRPVAISRCSLFRHLLQLNPSIVIDQSINKWNFFTSWFDKNTNGKSLKEIQHNGIEPLKPLYELFSENTFIARFKQILTQIEDQRESILGGLKKFSHLG
ncbi:MAG: hypothetical protein V4487_03205 [Chlamydiota bacterium]